MREELIPKSFTLTGSLYESCDIHELDSRRNYLGTIHHSTDLFETIIVDIHDTSIGLYCTEREVRSFSSIRLRESIEESGFTNIRETDDTNLHEKKEKVLKFEPELREGAI
jgi:hypothetical protein